MRRVLVVERSSTLCHMLAKQLRQEQYTVVTAPSFEEGLQQLAESSPQDFWYDAVVVSWPKYPHPKAAEFFDQLMQEGKQESRATIVMTHEDDEDLSPHDWTDDRPHSALAYWQDYRMVPHLLARLFPQPPRSTANLADAPMRILFVDDSASVRLFYRRLMTRHGYQVETAGSVEEGLQKALEQPFDIAIIDYFLPGANGSELCRALVNHRDTAEITSAIFTSSYLDQVIKDALKSGAVECMFKNEAPELFLARIAAMSRSIRARKVIESERQRLDGILNSVGDGVFGLDNQGVITFINPAAGRILGHEDFDALIGRRPQDIFLYGGKNGAENPLAKTLNAIVRDTSSTIHTQDTVFRHFSGKPIPVHCAIYPLTIEGRRAGAVAAFHDISERRRLENELRWQASHDPLTKLLNRRCFEEYLEDEVKRLHRSSETDALFYIDLDRFKYINDTAGHVAGDRLLIEIGEQLRLRLRGADLLARLGGDEFALIVRNVDVRGAAIAAEAFREVLAIYPFHYNGKTYQIGGSIGVAMISQDTQSSSEVLANADIACHMAKRKGRNQIHIYSGSDSERSLMRLELGWSERLRRALTENHFVLHYQPIVSMLDLNNWKGSRDIGPLWRHYKGTLRHARYYEVLVRLRGDDGDLIPPGAFISTAERFNMMGAIDRWVLLHAMTMLSERGQERRDIRLAVNLSAQSLADETLIGYLKDLFERFNIHPTCLTLEVTETSAMGNVEQVRKTIEQIRELGCRFALDDFGTGFSSFSHIKYLPADFIKIDGMFVKGMATDPADLAMVKSINDIAHALGRYTIAEYVESAEILGLLKLCNVDFVQGYYISEPQAQL